MDKWMQGYMCAVVTMINLNAEVDTRTRELFQIGIGKLDLQDLKNMGVDEFDINVLKRHWDELIHKTVI